MKKFLKWLIPCLVACFMVVGLVQTASFTFAVEEDQTSQLDNSNDSQDDEETKEDSEVVPNAPTHKKQVNPIDGTTDEYYLSIDVTGEIETEPGEDPQVDVVLVVDTSGSMDEGIPQYTEISYSDLYQDNQYAYYAEYNGEKYRVLKDDQGHYYFYYSSYQYKWIDQNDSYPLYKALTKMTALNNAVTDSTNGLSKAILKNQNAQMAVVTFNRTANLVCDWTNQIDSVNYSIPTGDAGYEGTNYHDGLIKAEECLEEVATSRPNSQKYIIFLSDGEPTYYIWYNQILGGAATDYNIALASNAANTQAESIKDTDISGFMGFYTIGFGIENNQNAQNILSTLSLKPTCSKKDSFLANDTASLVNVFNSILAEIIENRFTNIKIEDILSDNVDLTPEMVIGDKGVMSGYKFKVTDSSGKEVENPGVTPTVVYSSSEKKISIQFPKDYQLVEGYTYSVKFKIRPNDNAYDSYAENKGNYPAESKTENDLEIGGDKDSGFYSNTGATLTYTFKGEENTVDYTKDQFVKVNPTSLTVNKNWQKSDGRKMSEDLPGSIEVELLKNGNATGKTITLNDENGWSNSFKYLNPNYSYSVKEKSDTTEYEVTYSGIENNSITITNRKLPTLTIKKKVEGLFGNKKQTFKVSITLTDANGKALSGTYGEATFDEYGVAVKEISVGKPIELTELPFGTKYTVEEDDYSSDGYTTSYKIDGEKTKDGCSGQLEKENKDGDDVVVITNTKDAVPPTGIIDNTPKGLGLIGSIVVEIAAIAFVLKKKRQLKM